jgi:oxygen-independent coproporphyrinogen-3 oxidase
VSLFFLSRPSYSFQTKTLEHSECTPINAYQQQYERSAETGKCPEWRRNAKIDAFYLHLPFCFHKCHYCDFFSVVEPEGQDAPQQEAFVTALIAEMRHRSEQSPIRPSTLFAGGGTPTFLRQALWERLLDEMRELGILDPESEQEFTVEANPETVTPELMASLVAGGVTRVSIGAQTFDRTSLKALERWHDPESVPRTVQICRDVGLANFSLDLIFAIPGQTLAMLDRDLDALLALEPRHLSTYGLTYEPNTPLTAKLRVGKIDAIDEALEREMYELVMTKLESAGYEHYEVSNWTLSDPVIDFRCQHNLAYWHNKNWLGVGPSAASHIDGQRWRNAPNLKRYLDGSPTPPTQDHEQLDANGRFAEQLMLGLRLREGIDADWFDQHPALRQDQRDSVNEFIGLELLQRTDGRLRLTRKGLFVADSVIAKLL